MPELPEVETLVRGLRAAGLPGARIAAVEVRCPRIVGGAPGVLRQTVVGRRVVAVGRRGKYIVVDLDDGARVLIHLRMTGKLRFGDAATPLGPHDHVGFTLADGRRLIYNDTRRFGRILPCGGATDPLAPLGPEPLEATFTPACVARRLVGRRRRIKPLLLDQTIIAGLGNIYVDEALWAARIHPETSAARLGAKELRRLHRAIRHVLSVAVANQGTTLGRGQTNFYSVAGRRGLNADRLKVFRRDGLPCPRCGATLARAVVAQRGTHFCPVCQRLDQSDAEAPVPRSGTPARPAGRSRR